MNKAKKAKEHQKAPGDERPRNEETSRPVPEQRSIEDPAGPDDSLVRQMSHADESMTRESDTESRGVVGYVDEHGLEDRPEEGTREYDTE